MDNLAGIYCKQGEYKEAESFHERALVIQKKVQVSAQPDTAFSLNNLAKLHNIQPIISNLKRR
ncbi:hypothetical protein BC938DRAFT_478324 [Jimgerdemannia flammicorona]|uniref:Uncharacterized protein n=1 Tax=Jimgerdemannia flammicorona TaxID=994334 RepID=A0A433P5U1_9FUNG|nr:hypothetical protein BC938DRAFT_478324 [Jimgerdemannia flammicorona]